MKTPIDAKYKNAIKRVDLEKSKILSHEKELETRVAINFFKKHSNFYKRKYKSTKSGSRNLAITKDLIMMFPNADMKKVSSYLNRSGILTFYAFLLLLAFINILIGIFAFKVIQYFYAMTSMLDHIFILSFVYCYFMMPISILICNIYISSSCIKTYLTKNDLE